MISFKLGDFSIEDIQFSSKEERALATACTDGKVRILDLRNPDS